MSQSWVRPTAGRLHHEQVFGVGGTGGRGQGACRIPVHLDGDRRHPGIGYPGVAQRVGAVGQRVSGRCEHDAPGGVRLGEPGSGGRLEPAVVLDRQHERDALPWIDPMRHPVEPGRTVPHVGFDPGALQVGGDRVARGHVRVRLGVAAGRRGGVDPPVVEDLRDVGNPIRALHQAQDHVDVLGAVELGAKPADLVDQRSPVDPEMTRVAVGAQGVRRPGGLEVQPDLLTVHDDVLVAVDHVEVGLEGDLVGDPLERVGGERVVVVEQSDVLAGGEFERGVGGGRDPAGGLVTSELDAVV